MERKMYIITDICVACGEPAIEGEMLCRNCQKKLSKEEPSTNPATLKTSWKKQGFCFKNKKKEKDDKGTD